MSRNYPKNYFHKNKVTKNSISWNQLFGFGFARFHEILSDSMKVYGIFMFGYFKYYFFSFKIIDFIFICGENNNYYIYFIK